MQDETEQQQDEARAYDSLLLRIANGGQVFLEPHRDEGYMVLQVRDLQGKELANVHLSRTNCAAIANFLGVRGQELM